MATRAVGHARPTLAMVARSAGVSVPTASKVLNGRADVARTTRARVEDAMRALDYSPPPARRPALDTRVVDLVFDDLVSPYSMEVLRGVAETGERESVDVVVGRFPGERSRGGVVTKDEAADWPRRLAAAGRQGVIVVTSELTPAHIAGFARARLPLVVIDPVNLPSIEITSVGATNWTGGLTATEHLLGLGHRRIAFAGGQVKASCSQARAHGYRAALDNAGVAVDPALVRHGRFTYDTGLRIGNELLDLAEPPTAVFAASDAIALGVLAAARRRGLRVPDQLSVVGFDDIDVASWSTPRLTTIRQPLEDMGRVAMRTVLRLAGGETLESHHVELATQLVVRDSTTERR